MNPSNTHGGHETKRRPRRGLSSMNRPWTCDQNKCPKSYASESALRIHKKRKHQIPCTSSLSAMAMACELRQSQLLSQSLSQQIDLSNTTHPIVLPKPIVRQSPLKQSPLFNTTWNITPTIIYHPPTIQTIPRNNCNIVLPSLKSMTGYSTKDRLPPLAIQSS